MITMESTLSDRMARYDAVPGLAPVRAAFHRALDTHKTFRAKAAEIAKDDKRTALGKREKAQAYIGTEAHRVLRTHKTVEKIKGKFADREKALQPKAPDPANVAAAVARSDLRNMLRGMPIGQKMALLLAPDADPMLLSAALELPNYASGINDQTRQLITAAVIERENPGALAALERDREALELLEVATRVLDNTARDVAGFPNDAVLSDFLAKSVGDTARLDADIDHEISAAA